MRGGCFSSSPGIFARSARRIRRIHRAVVVGVGSLLFPLAGSSCALENYRLDLRAVDNARLAFAQLKERDLYYAGEEKEEEEVREKGTVGEAIAGELLAIFPGVIVHGLGHLYAGDERTFGRLSRLGQMGYVLTAVGGGLIVGGYYLERDDTEVLGQSLTKPVAYGLYGTGGVAGGIGVMYFLTAWIYDMIDTPRAVLSGGKPPPRSEFVESLEIFK